MTNRTNSIRDFIVGMYMPPPETRELHEKLLTAVKAGAPADEIEALFQACPEGECAICGMILCPHEEPLHFHHDGCPACDGGSEENKQ